MIDRRRFLGILMGALAGLGGWRGAAAAVRGRRVVHPEPRPGITSANVLPADQVPAKLVELYDGVRRIPQIVDGIGCYCGCAEIEGFYSLLTCYEQSAMATHCDICQGEGALAVEMHGQGRTLAEIRAAIDRRFG